MAPVDRNRKVEVKRETGAAAVAPVERPDWVLSGLAAAGMLIAAYLTWLKLSGLRSGALRRGQRVRHRAGESVRDIPVGADGTLGPRHLPGDRRPRLDGAHAAQLVDRVRVGRRWCGVFGLPHLAVRVRSRRDLCLVSHVSRHFDRNARRPRDAPARGAEPEASDELRPARHLRRARCRGHRRRRRLRVCRYRSPLAAGLPMRARTALWPHESGDVGRILVTGVPRAKGPVRARVEGHPVCGV